MGRWAEVRVPATTANLGPAFDCMGLALDIWNTVRAEWGPQAVHITGQGEQDLSRGEDNLVVRSARALFERAGHPFPGLTFHCHNDIPLARGLGSSAAAVVAGLLVANALLGGPLSHPQLLALAVELEGHPDNVAPALEGGCRVVVRDTRGCLLSAPVPWPPQLGLVLFVPDVSIPTQEARALLADRVNREDVVFNLGRVALLVNALASGRLEHLSLATQDRLHQPARAVLFPALPRLLESALEAGALGAFLSGAGPTVAALVAGDGGEVGRALAQRAGELGLGGRVCYTRPAPKGAHITGEG